MVIIQYILHAATCPALFIPENGMIECIPGVPTPPPEPIPAPVPTPPTNPPPGDSRDLRGADAMTDSVAGDICIVICNEGYQLRGSENRTCGDDGTWDGTDTTCTVPPGMTVYLTICKLFIYRQPNCFSVNTICVEDDAVFSTKPDH